MDLIEEFNKRVMPEPMSGCWLWIGVLHDTGYGRMLFHGVMDYAHRWAYRIHKGEIGDNFVLHNCDNKLCVNPDHLFLGTHQDNVQDMYRKGRGLKTRVRLNQSVADQIRILLLGGSNKSELALRFNVSKTTITRIVKNQTFTNGN